MAKMAFALPAARSVLQNPTQAELHALAKTMPNARETSYGAVNVQTRVLSRSKGSTFIVADDPETYPHQAIDRDEWERMSARQDAYIAEAAMIQVDGFIGNDPEHRVPTRLFVEAAFANIAGMQDVLYFHDPEAEFEPELVVVYTPGLAAAGYPDDRLIAVNLDLHVTRVFNSDYFGESKKGGLRMWNELVHERGGLALHAGCKVIPTPRGDRVGLIVGLSGTGKTTTTFTRQNGSLPVQDDFVAWWPDGSVSATEAGCFAKTFALNPKDEPTIYGAVTRPDAYLENVSQSDAGEVDFFDQAYTKNGRAVFAFADIEAADAVAGPPGRLPAHPEPQREHHPGGRQARGPTGRGVLHARRDHGHVGRRRGRGGQVPARSRARTPSSRSRTTSRATGSSSSWRCTRSTSTC